MMFYDGPMMFYDGPMMFYDGPIMVYISVFYDDGYHVHCDIYTC